MKKFKILMMVVIAIILQTTMMACGSDDNDEKEAQKAVFFKYSFDFTEDVLSVADVSNGYIGTDGVEKWETVTSTSWSKTFTADKYDVSAGVAVTMKLKNSVVLTKEKYKIGYAYSYTVKSTNDGKYVDGISGSPSRMDNVPAEKVESQLELRNGVLAFHIDAIGKVSTTELSWQNNIIKISL